MLGPTQSRISPSILEDSKITIVCKTFVLTMAQPMARIWRRLAYLSQGCAATGLFFSRDWLICPKFAPFSRARWARDSSATNSTTSSPTMYYLNGFRKSTPHKIVNLSFFIAKSPTYDFISNCNQQVNDFVGELTFWNHSINTFCEMRPTAPPPLPDRARPLGNQLWMESNFISHKVLLK